MATPDHPVVKDAVPKSAIPHTPRNIITLIVVSIIILGAVYVATMAYMVANAAPQLNQETPDFPGRILDAFVHVGDVLIGALIGLLINTRSTSPAAETTSKGA